jgi:hypothetical protein
VLTSSARTERSGSAWVDPRVTPPQSTGGVVEVKRSLILLALALPLVAQDSLYYPSVGALAAGTVADSISSWGRKEANPLLGSTFNTQSLAVKSGVLGGTILLQRYAIHKNPKIQRTLTWLNFAVGAGLGGVAFRNFRLRSGK